MVKWHEDEAQLSRQRHASAAGGAQGNEVKGDNRRSVRKTAEDESRKETADRVARHHQADAVSVGTSLCYSCRQLLQLVRT